MPGTETDRRPFWRQPLVHFLIAGLAIFALNALRGTPTQAGSNKIVVTLQQVERLAGLWDKTWGRPPSETELQGLVRDYIKEEVYYREALKLGLDVNDTVIRRRMRQKMEFLTTDDIDLAEPSDDVLQAYLDDNAEKYRTSLIYSFQQVYFGDDDPTRIAAALLLLSSGHTPDNMGDPIGLPRTMSEADKADIARTFGSAFYKALEGLQPDIWSAPITSGFGAHLVQIETVIPVRMSTLSEVRKNVLNDWRTAARKAKSDATYEALRQGYSITIELPEE